MDDDEPVRCMTQEEFASWREREWQSIQKNPIRRRHFEKQAKLNTANTGPFNFTWEHKHIYVGDELVCTIPEGCLSMRKRNIPGSLTRPRMRLTAPTYGRVVRRDLSVEEPRLRTTRGESPKNVPSKPRSIATADAVPF